MTRVYELGDRLAGRECVGVCRKAMRDVQGACGIVDCGRARVDRLYAAIYTATNEVLYVVRSIRGRDLTARVLEKVKTSMRTCMDVIETGVIALLAECRRMKQCAPFANTDTGAWLAGTRMPVVICEWLHRVRDDFEPIRRFCDEYLLPGYRVLLREAANVSEMVYARICVLIARRRRSSSRTRGDRTDGASVRTPCRRGPGCCVYRNKPEYNIPAMADVILGVVIALVLIIIFTFGYDAPGLGFLILMILGFMIIHWCYPRPAVVTPTGVADSVPPPSS